MGWIRNTAGAINDCCLTVVDGSSGRKGGSYDFSAVSTGSKTT